MFIKFFKHRQMSYSIVKELEKNVEFDFGNSLLIYHIRLFDIRRNFIFKYDVLYPMKMKTSMFGKKIKPIWQLSLFGKLV